MNNILADCSNPTLHVALLELLTVPSPGKGGELGFGLATHLVENQLAKKNDGNG